jgi:hypothetical protein
LLPKSPLVHNKKLKSEARRPKRAEKLAKPACLTIAGIIRGHLVEEELV